MPASYAMFNSVNKMEVYNYKAEKKAGKSKGDYIHGIVVILAEIDAFVHRDEQEQYVDSVEVELEVFFAFDEENEKNKENLGTPMRKKAPWEKRKAA